MPTGGRSGGGAFGTADAEGRFVLEVEVVQAQGRQAAAVADATSQVEADPGTGGLGAHGVSLQRCVGGDGEGAGAIAAEARGVEVKRDALGRIAGVAQLQREFEGGISWQALAEVLNKAAVGQTCRVGQFQDAAVDGRRHIPCAPAVHPCAEVAVREQVGVGGRSGGRAFGTADTEGRFVLEVEVVQAQGRQAAAVADATSQVEADPGTGGLGAHGVSLQRCVGGDGEGAGAIAAEARGVEVKRDALGRIAGVAQLQREFEGGISWQALAEVLNKAAVGQTCRVGQFQDAAVDGRRHIPCAPAVHPCAEVAVREQVGVGGRSGGRAFGTADTEGRFVLEVEVVQAQGRQAAAVADATSQVEADPGTGGLGAHGVGLQRCVGGDGEGAGAIAAEARGVEVKRDALGRIAGVAQLQREFEGGISWQALAEVLNKAAVGQTCRVGQFQDAAVDGRRHIPCAPAVHPCAEVAVREQVGVGGRSGGRAFGTADTEGRFVLEVEVVQAQGRQAAAVADATSQVEADPGTGGLGAHGVGLQRCVGGDGEGAGAIAAEARGVEVKRDALGRIAGVAQLQREFEGGISWQALAEVLNKAAVGQTCRVGQFQDAAVDGRRHIPCAPAVHPCAEVAVREQVGVGGYLIHSDRRRTAVGVPGVVGDADPVGGRSGEDGCGEAGAVGADGRGGVAGGAVIPLIGERCGAGGGDGERDRLPTDDRLTLRLRCDTRHYHVSKNGCFQVQAWYRSPSDIDGMSRRSESIDNSIDARIWRELPENRKRACDERGRHRSPVPRCVTAARIGNAADRYGRRDVDAGCEQRQVW